MAHSFEIKQLSNGHQVIVNQLTKEQVNGLGQKLYEENRSKEFTAQIPDNEWQKSHPCIAASMNKTVVWLGG